VRRIDERSDEELARAAQSGDSAAFERLVERMLDPVYNFLLRSQRAADAEEIAHETFVRAWQKLSTYRSEYRFSTWVFTLARRLSVGASRERARRAAGELALLEAKAPLDPHDPAERAQSKERADRLWTLAERILSSEQRTALWLRYAEDQSVAEIATVLGRGSATVRVILYRARQRLAPFVGGLEDPGMERQEATS
jgi:RNA polymerase sigma-70 factor (ECF subfamily)